MNALVYIHRVMYSMESYMEGCCLCKASFGGTALYTNGSLGGNTMSVLLSECGCISNKMVGNQMVVSYSSQGLNDRPFNNQTFLDHLNTKLVRYSDPHCSRFSVTWGKGGYKKSKLAGRHL